MATVLLVVLAPLLVFIALAIFISSGAPILFRQERIGLAGRPFTILKYRTMRPPRTASEADPVGDAARITLVGRALRAMSLDELPQLINVLVGEMSIVGPRPTLRDQVERYTDFQRRRLLVRPGITGWAQINGRNSLAWSKRIELDVWYVEHLSVMLDTRIVFRTLPALVRRDGVYGPDGINPDLDE
ncbi:MAG: sugar transferase [Actinobacteria bacterium HGW-Actinobacteria-7]|jgi:lipopolysaccharide/colanic/teichoic acid biosynthesis glycosyltransferase|nr:MAG: sugar transferase [Actinobacteria bacterium HGW-Actinobacteria-7]